MIDRALVASMAIAMALCAASASAWSQEGAKFPDWKGQWVRTGAGGQYDPSKPAGRGQQPPLTPEYQAIWEANIAEGRSGGQYYNPQVRCMLSGMPRMMIAYEPLEVIVLPEITYIHITFNSEFRRIYTDGRDWPILLQNSLLRCQRAIIESEKPASRIRYCALWLVLESMLRVGSLENSFATISGQKRTRHDPQAVYTLGPPRRGPWFYSPAATDRRAGHSRGLLYLSLDRQPADVTLIFQIDSTTNLFPVKINQRSNATGERRSIADTGAE